MALNFANNNSLSAITSLPASISGGVITLLQTQTASSSSSITFTSGIDSTYKEYIFKLINVRPATDSVILGLNFSIDGGSNYNVTKTTTFFRAFHSEADSTSFGYVDAQDLAQSTGDQNIMWNIGNGSDEASCSIIQLFNPSSTTFVKHFIARSLDHAASDGAGDRFIAGYCNTTSAVNGVRFQFSSGNIASGTFKLYGVL